MHLVFTTYENKAEFGVSKNNDYTGEMRDVYEYFAKEPKYSEKMKKYIEYYHEERRLGALRSAMLKELKLTFKEEFMPEFEDQNPEYFI